MWEKDKTEQIGEIEKTKNDDKEELDFLKLIDKEYDETIYTNMLYYYFNQRKGNNIILNYFLRWLKKEKKINIGKFNFEKIVKEKEIKDNIYNEFKEYIKQNQSNKLEKYKNDIEYIDEQIKVKKKFGDFVKAIKERKEFFEEFKKWLKNEKNLIIDDDLEKLKSKFSQKGRMDLWAINDEVGLIIENKIKSGLNGKDKDGSQLQTYYNYAKKQNLKEIIGLIFVPKYNINEIERDKDYIKLKDKYTIITYSNLLKFFSKKEYKEWFKKQGDKYYEDFLLALKKQTITAEEKEYNKFVKAIRELDKETIKYYVFAKKDRKEKL